MTVMGYVRKGYPEETSAQIALLRTYDCEILFIEPADLTLDDELYRLLNQLVKGDTIIVVSLLSLGKGINELTDIVHQIILKEAVLISIKDNINTAEYYLFQDILSIINTTHSQIASDKVKRKLGELKVSGQHLGRPSVNQETVDRMIHLRKQQVTLRDISEQCGVSVATVHKYINKYINQIKKE